MLALVDWGRSQRLHGFGLPSVSLQIAKNRQKPDSIVQAMKPDGIVGILLQRSFYSSQAKPICRDMRELPRVMFQREQGCRIPGRYISENNADFACLVLACSLTLLAGVFMDASPIVP